ncbi:ATP-dependent DNA helicase II subunit 2 [Orbilia oligospora]|uniref:ATP-dependent DNA helicase II subunit 2 n=2 Tax=Orbilia oligospora TaxID=2813651 RepID=A0A7C8P2N4_ORBOL|nr:ATP-dependent DNA helicase II subunit 2 [Orbilia oligospora]KAF3196466.1 ATP-dependent DNA helicase II subunit 2 [Orbilia oligospora]KAF3206944.1 ATP-dependent DNA helicase II subunit 2 [Orbilia oligospora]
MADKQATVYIVDLGASMGAHNAGRTETDLEYALKYLWDRIATTVSNGRKTDTIAVVGFRTDGSDNSLFQNDENYSNISILSPMSQFLMPQIRELNKLLEPNATDRGDGVSALVVALDMIEKYCKKLKYIRNIVFLTNGTGNFDFDGINDIIEQITEQKINLTILGVDFDDLEFGVVEKDKSLDKAENERALKELCGQCDGMYGTIAEAIEEIQRPRTKKTRPVHSFRGQLSIGNESANPTSTLLIDVERFPRTMVAKPPTASSFAVPSERDSVGGNLHKIRNTRTFQVGDEDAPGKAIDIEREDMAKGYLYGRTIVPISVEDQEIVKFDTEASLKIVGFIPKSGFERSICLSNSNIIVASKANDEAIMALSSFIHALYELDSLVIGRLVTKDDKPPVMIAMAPIIEPSFECLVEVQLPFAEDARQYKFAPLNTVRTTTGKVLDKHRLIPTQELQEAMDDYVDSMDLMNLEGLNDPLLPFAQPEDIFSPVLHRIQQVIRARAIAPDSDGIPEVSPILLNYSTIPLGLDPEEDLDRLGQAADVCLVPAKAKGKKIGRDKPLSGLDVGRLLEERTKSKRIDKNNPIPEFRQMIASAQQREDIQLLVQQMGDIIKDIIRYSIADLHYSRAIECLRALREDCITLEAFEFYDSFIRELKSFTEADRKDFWSRVRKDKLGLVLPTEDIRSKTTIEESNRLYYGR